MKNLKIIPFPYKTDEGIVFIGEHPDGKRLVDELNRKYKGYPRFVYNPRDYACISFKTERLKKP